MKKVLCTVLALAMALTLLAGCRDYNGAGGHVIAAALGGTAKPEAPEALRRPARTHPAPAKARRAQTSPH